MSSDTIRRIIFWWVIETIRVKAMLSIEVLGGGVDGVWCDGVGVGWGEL